MSSRSSRSRKLLITSTPKVKDTPRSFSSQPSMSGSGSDLPESGAFSEVGEVL